MKLNNVRNQNGQSLTEYMILVLMISVASIALTKGLGSTIKDKINEAKTQISSEVKFNYMSPEKKQQPSGKGEQGRPNLVLD